MTRSLENSMGRQMINSKINANRGNKDIKRERKKTSIYLRKKIITVN